LMFGRAVIGITYVRAASAPEMIAKRTQPAAAPSLAVRGWPH
jgi:hypothetical protein